MVDLDKRVWITLAIVVVGGCSSSPSTENAAPGTSSGSADAATSADVTAPGPPLDDGGHGRDDASGTAAVGSVVDGGSMASPAPDAGVSDAPSSDAGANDAAAAGDASGALDDAAPLPATLPLAQVTAAKPEFLGLVTGGRAEGVTWRNGEVFFSLVSQGYYRLKADGHIYKYLALKPNGSYLLGDGSILVCDDTYTVVQVFPDTGKVGIVGGNGGVCNDVRVDAWGNIYFSDFINTVYRITPAGVQTKAVTGLPSPNGIAVDPASKYLYVLPRPSDIYRVAIDADGPVGTPQKVGQLAAITDGCHFDAWGNLWASVFGTGQIAIFDPTQLKVVASISAGAAGNTNLVFGGPNRDTLFVTTESHGLFKIPVGARGATPFPGAPKYALKGYVNVTPVDVLVP